MRVLRFTAAWLILCCPGLPAADAGEEKAILAAIQTLFDGMAAHDAAAIESAMTADARLIGVRGDQPARNVSRGEFASSIAANRSRLLERIWEPKVMVRGRIAMVWAEYDFHADGKFGHCGVDSFLMLKTAEGWKATAISYTAETENCAPSPLGPPKP
jgi:ketosteroid isomerase-like protein